MSHDDSGEAIATLAPRSRLLLAAALGVALAFAVVGATLRAVSPPPAPTEVRPGPPLARAFTRRLALVIVDGLRYDVATDPALMPHFSAEMETRASGEIWAGQVSMTTSAVLSLGTGQRGRLEQVIRNVDARSTSFNSWFENAAAAGLRTASVGDPAWPQMYGPHLWEHRTDPEGVAIDVDFNPITFSASREVLGLVPGPDAVVLHFGTPDHQGHAYGIRSKEYAKHIRGFDVDLAHLLAELSPEWTVIVTSDHGAADSGTHGSDTPLQRRSPVYAYGPGIKAGEKLDHPADQLDLSATVPVLLGVAPPAHGLGHVLTAWLATSEAQGAAIARGNAERVLAYATHAAGAARTAPLGEELARCQGHLGCSLAAERAVRAAEAAVSGSTGLSAPDAPLWLAVVLLLGLALGYVLLPEMTLGTLALVSALLVVTVLLVMGVERLPSFWPNGARIPLFAASNAVLLALLVAPSATARWLERRTLLLPVLAPSLLAVSYPANTRPEAYIVLSVLAIVLVGRGALGAGQGTFLEGSRASLPWADVTMLGASLLLLLPTLLRESDTYSGTFRGAPLRNAVSTIFTAAVFAWLARPLATSRPRLLLVVVCGAAALWLRPILGPVVGRGLWLGSALAFAALLVARRLDWAILMGAASVSLVSRPFESIPLLAAVAVATVVAKRFSVASALPSPTSARTTLLLLVTLQVALAYALRIGVQDGVDFGGMYWGAGAFNDPHVSPFVIGLALSFKYAMGVALVGLALRPAFPEGQTELSARAVMATFVFRTLSLFSQFSLAGGSYWTAMRIFGDLPTAVAMTLGALGLVLLETRHIGPSPPGAPVS